MNIKLVVIFFLCSNSAFTQIDWVSRNLPVNEKVKRIYFCDANTGFACTENVNLIHGDVYKTTNSGINWIKSINDFYGKPANIQFFDSSNAIVIGDRIVYKTSNRGVTWTSTGFFSSNFGTQCENFYFLNSSTGIAFTRGGKEYYFMRTTNGGANWDRVYYSAGSTPKYPSFIFSDANTGYMVAGSSSKKTTNAGLNWSSISLGLLNSRFLYKHSSEIYFSVGYEDNYRSYSKTTNSGINWSYQNYSGMPAFHSMAFVNQNIGFICGQGGLLQYTTNQGTNWIDYNIGTTANLNSIYFINNSIGFVAGDSGKIYKTTNTGGLTNIVTLNSVPDNYSLEQNYPNPFNPETKIKFSIPETQNVTLQVYNVQGKMVAELLKSSDLKAGNYEVNFNSTAFHLSSGTYYYTLKTDKFTQTKKMTIVK